MIPYFTIAAVIIVVTGLLSVHLLTKSIVAMKVKQKLTNDSHDHTIQIKVSVENCLWVIFGIGLITFCPAVILDTLREPDRLEENERRRIEASMKDEIYEELLFTSKTIEHVLSSNSEGSD